MRTKLTVSATILAMVLTSLFFSRAALTQQDPPPVIGESLPTTTTEVRRGSIRSVVVLDAVVRASSPIDIVSTELGIVDRFLVRPGSNVTSGQRIVSIRRSDGSRQDVTSPVNGVLSDPLVEPGATVIDGQRLISAWPSTFEGVAPIEPSLLYRFYDEPKEISARVDHGPAPFACPLLAIGADNLAGGNPLDAPVQLTCAVPQDIRVFAGVRLKIAVVTGEARNVLLLPVETVVGEADRGYVTLVRPDGGQIRRDVRLGLTDGVNVEVISGLAENDRVLDPPAVSDPGLITPGVSTQP